MNIYQYVNFGLKDKLQEEFQNTKETLNRVLPGSNRAKINPNKPDFGSIDHLATYNPVTNKTKVSLSPNIVLNGKHEITRDYVIHPSLKGVNFVQSNIKGK